MSNLGQACFIWHRYFTQITQYFHWHLLSCFSSIAMLLPGCSYPHQTERIALAVSHSPTERLHLLSLGSLLNLSNFLLCRMLSGPCHFSKMDSLLRWVAKQQPVGYLNGHFPSVGFQVHRFAHSYLHLGFKALPQELQCFQRQLRSVKQSYFRLL